jgi:hypothetical protein
MTFFSDLLPAGPASLLALAVALAVARLARSRPWLAALAAAWGIFAGWWLLLGLPSASPRQLAERLPLLLAGMLVFALALTPILRVRPRLAPALTPLGALAAGWWMAGAPLILPDLQRSLPVLVLGSAMVWALAQRMSPALTPAAALVLLAGLVAAGLPGPHLLLSVIVLAACLGAWWNPVEPAPLHGLPVAAALAALGLIPIIARGAPADWVAASAPLLVLWLAPLLGARGRGGLAALAGPLAIGGAVFVLAKFMR